MKPNRSPRSAFQILAKYGNINFVSRRKKFIIICLSALVTTGIAIPSGIYTVKFMNDYFNKRKIAFTGTNNLSNLCNVAPFNQLPWCSLINQPFLVNLSKTPIRDTTYENYDPHYFNGKLVSYYDVTGKNGSIASNNLRFEYTYNNIVNTITGKNASKLLPGLTNLKVKSIDVSYSLSNTNPDFNSAPPLAWSDVIQNQSGLLLQVMVSSSEDNPRELLLPVVIYNTGSFYSNFFTYFMFGHHVNYYFDRSKPASSYDQRRGIMVNMMGRNIVVPESVWNSIDPLAVNDWMYKYWHQVIDTFYVQHWTEFRLSKPLVPTRTLFSNLLLYSPALIGNPDEAMYNNDNASILNALPAMLYNQKQPQNSITPVDVVITKNIIQALSQAKLNYYLLFLDPQYSLRYYYNEFDNDLNKLAALFALFADPAENMKFDQLNKLAQEHPFIKKLHFEPWQVILQENTYNHRLNEPYWYLAQTISLFDTNQRDISNAGEMMEFFFRYWSPVNDYVVSPIGSTYNFLNGPWKASDFLNILEPSVRIVQRIVNGESLDVHGISISDINDYFDVLARYKMFYMIESYATNYPSILQNVPTGSRAFLGFYNYVQQADIQNEIYELFLGKDHGINETRDGYYTTVDIRKNITGQNSDYTFLTGITMAHVFYQIAPTTNLRRFGTEPIANYAVISSKITFAFTLDWTT